MNGIISEPTSSGEDLPSAPDRPESRTLSVLAALPDQQPDENADAASSELTNDTINQALKTMYRLSKLRDQVDLPRFEVDDSMIQAMLCDILQSCSQDELTEYVFACLFLVCSSPSVIFSTEALRVCFKIAATPKATTSLKVAIFRLLQNKRISRDAYTILEPDILQCVRQVNTEERWSVKIVAVRFYQSLLKDCAQLMFNKKVDFIWTIMEDFPPVLAPDMNREIMRYLISLLAGDDFVVNNLMLLLDADAIRLIAKRFEPFVGRNSWFKLLLGFTRIEPARRLLDSDVEKKRILRFYSKTNDFALLVYAFCVGIDQLNKELNGCDNEISRLLKLIDKRIRENIDDYSAGYRLLEPAMVVLQIIRTKPLERIFHSTALFLKDNLIGRLVLEAFSRLDLQLLFTTVEVMFRLGFRSQDREALYKCLITAKVHGRLDRLRSALVLPSEDDRERLNEICSWRPRESPTASLAGAVSSGAAGGPMLTQIVDALQKVTQCDAALCERLLRVNEMNLPKAIQAFFNLKEQMPHESPQRTIEILLEAEGQVARLKELEADAISTTYADIIHRPAIEGASLDPTQPEMTVTSDSKRARLG